jgi:hypothetical protein
MKKPSDTVVSPLRRQVADVLRRARKLPVGHARNDLRQLAVGLLWLEKRGFVVIEEEHAGALQVVKGTQGASASSPLPSSSRP